MGRVLLLNNWQPERRGSEQERIEVRKVISPEYKGAKGRLIPPALSSDFYVLRIFWSLYIHERFAEKACFSLQQCSASHLKTHAGKYTCELLYLHVLASFQVGTEKRDEALETLLSIMNLVHFNWMYFTVTRCSKQSRRGFTVYQFICFVSLLIPTLNHEHPSF